MLCIERVRIEPATGVAGAVTEQYIATPTNSESIRQVAEWANWFIEDAKSKAAGMSRTITIDPRLIRTLDSPARYQDSMLVTVSNFLIERSTPTGRLPKYPLTLHLSAYRSRDAMGDGTHGEIAYLADGRPGKMWFACWGNGRLWTVNCKLVAGKMKVSYIDTHDARGNKSRSYDYRTAEARA